ncbi:MAG TPA: sigma-70 family RNA polymerase sigma factor [Flavisolibacter sp.]|nr:sigma-70 family RNA polymerase sigma factor [Flavisolibacter sp.]
MVKETTELQFEKAIKTHERLLFKVCWMYARTQTDRDDLYQEIVLQLWHSYPRFRGDAQFSTWLYRVALNTAISGKRRQKDLTVSYEPDKLPVLSETLLPDESDELNRLYAAISRLNEIEKALVMLYLDDHSYDEMESIMGISSGALRVKMNRIKEKLRQLTKNND